MQGLALSAGAAGAGLIAVISELRDAGHLSDGAIERIAGAIERDVNATSVAASKKQQVVENYRVALEKVLGKG